ncbi:hypothetical protein LTR94_028457 [Friedmanniomyces endolithicus]|nr:hypothetical protein LTR94_028457 [Friedmanniomyces endolithicus]
MCFALFVPDPRHIVMVGLGGGSLAKFCHRHFPRARITVLEIRDDVIALRDQFCLPPDDARLRILHQRLDTGAQDHAGAGDRGIIIEAYDMPALARCALAADAKLILDRCRALLIRGIASVQGNAIHQAFPSVQGLNRRIPVASKSEILRVTSIRRYAVDGEQSFLKSRRQLFGQPDVEARLSCPLVHALDAVAQFG